MGRRIRYIDEVGDIKEWVAAMSALNDLLKEVDIKGSSDNWRPWKRTKDVVKEDTRKKGSQSWDGSLAPTKGMVTEKIWRRNRPFLAKVSPPRVQVEETILKCLTPKLL